MCGDCVRRRRDQGARMRREHALTNQSRSIVSRSYERRTIRARSGVMSSRVYMTILVLASLTGRAGADDTASTDTGPAGSDGGPVSKDDGFFTRIKILGSTT